ncbi:MAG: hypothetical protein GTN76_03955 [Candidatus Aenigmarchaeota archaeon]|nr:hypothetical protein [Candidatus Aenigmarchaeota archaeon]
MTDGQKKVIESEYPPICKHCGKGIETSTAGYNPNDDSLYHPPPHSCGAEEYRKNGGNLGDDDVLEIVELKVRFKKIPEKIRFDLQLDGLTSGKRRYVNILGKKYYRALRLVPESEDPTPHEERDCEVRFFRTSEGDFKKYNVYQLVKILGEEYPVIWGSFIELDHETVLKLKRAAKNSKPGGNKKVK